MRKLLGIFIISLSLIPVMASAKAKPSYCGTSTYDIHYASIFAYPTGSYWQKQIAAYPDYYAAHNAFYQANYGC